MSDPYSSSKEGEKHRDKETEGKKMQEAKSGATGPHEQPQRMMIPHVSTRGSPPPPPSFQRNQSPSSASSSSKSSTRTNMHMKPIRKKKKMSIADFELLRVLGTGSSGRVVAARHKQSHVVYAIKIVHKFGMDEQLKKSFKRERDVLREVHHPFVATLEFAFQNEDKLYMVMEYLSGGTIRYHMNLHYKQQQQHRLNATAVPSSSSSSSSSSKAPFLFTPASIRLYAAELVAALAHLHSLGITYGDLKPENILIAHDGHLKLVDFGGGTSSHDDHGAHLSSKDAFSSSSSSPAYVAPEVLHGNAASVGHTCDWWSLGVVLYEMYMGHTPFEDESTTIMMRNILDGPANVYVPPSIGAAASSLLQGLICRDATKRLGRLDETVPYSIMNHAYFDGMDWDALQAKTWVQPEWVPDPDEVYVEDNNVSSSYDPMAVPVDTPEWRMLDEVDRQREHVNDFTFRPTETILSETTK
jgi:serine/threonine protein kinase